MNNYPNWVLKHKAKNIEIRYIKGNYYSYKIRNIWDSKKKRARKITEKYLGKITPEGLTKPAKERALESVENIVFKEFGASDFILSSCSDIIEKIKANFGNNSNLIILMAIYRFIHNSRIKNLEFYYETSFLSETIRADLSPRLVGIKLREIGMQRALTQKYLKNFMVASEYEIIDLTHIFSLSEGVISSTIGYNGNHDYTSQIRMVLLFDPENHTPSYYRFVVGAIKDISTLKLTIEESGASNIILVGDKGFYSKNNVEELEKLKIHYILPLKRDSSLIDYAKIQKGSDRVFDGYFLFERRAVWYYSYIKESKRIVVYIDELLRTEEKKDFLSRIEEKKYEKTTEDYFEKESIFGTISVITDLEKSPKELYELLKSRVEVEQVFDTYKNTLQADRMYMRDDYQLEGWMLINFIALQLYYKIYTILLSKDLLRKNSPHDLIEHLLRIFKLRINNEWKVSEIPKKTKDLMEKLEINIPHNT